MTRSRGSSKLYLALLLAAVGLGAVILWVRRGPPERFEDLSSREQEEFRSSYQDARQGIRLGRWDDAEAALDRCLVICRGDPQVYASLAEIYLGRRREMKYRRTEDPREGVDEEDALVDRALAEADRALSIDPHCVAALKVRHVIRGGSTLRRYDPDGALADGEEVLRLAPEDMKFRRPYIAWLLSDVRFRRGRAGWKAYDSGIGLEVAEPHIEWMLERAPVGSEAYIQALHALGTVYLYMGDFERAAAAFEQLEDPAVQPEPLPTGAVDLGTALYRLGRYPEAAEHLRRSMRAQKTLRTAWLLRLTYEKMGRDMAGLERGERFPLPPEAFDRDRPPKLEFTEIGERMGVAKVDGAGPSAFADYDGDGDADILAAGCDTFTALYRNDGERFHDVTIEAGLYEMESGFSTNLVDYDNDGDLDIYVCRNGWSGPARNLLYRNRGDGTFEDRSSESGLDDPGNGFVSLWADFDRDGLLDVYIANGVLQEGSTNRLYRNIGKGRFEDWTERWGLAESRRWGTIGAAIGDYDRDGDPDIFVNGRTGAPNRLYRNRGDGHFDEAAREAGVDGPLHNGYVAFFTDYDNDTFPDILTVSLASWESVLRGLARIGVPSSPGEMDRDVPRLYRNDRDGTFTDVTFEAGLIYPHGVMGANVADLDNDGHIDLYFGTGDPMPGRLEPSVFYRNRGDGTFVDLTRFTGLGHLGKGHGFTFADFDLDGDLDIYAPQGGFRHGDLWANPFYRNEKGNENHWIHLRLRGTTSNRFAVGAQVTVTSGDLAQYREVHGGVGFGSTDSYPVEFGLGERTKVDTVEILWPSGKRQTLPSPPADALIEVEEGRDGWKVIHRGGGG